MDTSWRLVDEPLTGRQREALAIIRQSMAQRGFPPTLRELARHLGIASPRGAYKHLAALEKKGYIRRIPGAARGVTLSVPSPSPSTAKDPVQVPLLGRVPAGPLDMVFDNADGFLSLDPSLAKDGDFFLRVKGDSMSGDAIADGDLALVRPLPSAENGSIVVALVDGEATLKRLRFSPGRLVLEPSNPSFQPMTFAEGSPEVTIIGRVVGLFRPMGSVKRL